jgi:hypothetical protein
MDLSPIVGTLIEALAYQSRAVTQEFYDTGAVDDDSAQNLYNAVLAALALGVPRAEVHAAMERGKAMAVRS